MSFVDVASYGIEYISVSLSYNHDFSGKPKASNRYKNKTKMKSVEVSNFWCL